MTDLTTELLMRRWRRVLSGIEAQGGSVLACEIARPATTAEVQEVEASLNLKLPPSFAKVLLTVARSAELHWSLPGTWTLCEELRPVFAGNIHWSLDLLLNCEESRQSWIETNFPDPEDPCDRHWHRKLSFYDVGNGDQIAIDLAPATYGNVIFLSHDDGQGHGLRLATDFETFIRDWTSIAGVGGEDWQWLPFYNHHGARLDPEGRNALKLRQALKLP